MKTFSRILPLCLLAGAWLTAEAEVKLPAVISSHMVLQRDKTVPIWGQAAPGEDVTVSFNGQTVKATADAAGKWMAKLAPMKAGGPFGMTIAGKNTIQLEDILIGEVWFCGGQSNMAFFVQNVTDGAAVVAAADHPNLRIFNTKRTIAETPQFTVEGEWVPCTPATVKESPAVAYFFALRLMEDLKVPVGLLHSSWGGTGAEVWMPKEVLEKDFPPILESWSELVAAYPQTKKALDAHAIQANREYERKAAEAKAGGSPAPAKPKKLEPRGAPGSRDTPTGGWYGMIVPHLPYAIRGIIWYQGETNAGRGYQYRKLFPALIAAWRAGWGENDLPFLFVQLPNMIRKKPPQPPDWPEVREAQLMTAKSVPGAGMVVAIDIGDPHDLHPKNKKPVGERLADIAEAMIYRHSDTDCTGPLYHGAKFDGGKAVLSFDSAQSGLEAREGALQGFLIAGKDQKFVPAEAKIEGDTVVVSSPQVSEPVAVRYAWEDNPVSSLYNKNGYPASPFRTDDWPENTVKNSRILQTKEVQEAAAQGASAPSPSPAAP